MNKKCIKWGDFNVYCGEVISYIEDVDNLI